MTATAFLTELRDLGIEVWADGQRLRYSAPKGAVTERLLEELRQRKSQLLELLRRDGRGKAATDAAVQRADIVAAAPGSPPRTTDRKGPLADGARLSPSSVADLPTHDHPYGRYVAPYRSFLYSQLGLDKRFVRGERCYLFDELGNRYVDFVAQYGALPFGCNPPEIWNALIEAREHQSPSFLNPGLMDAAGELAERLVGIAPGDMPHVTFANSGTEAVEIALKLARSSTGRNGILSTINAFHGLTLGSMSATGRDTFQRHFGAPVPGFDHIAYGDVGALQTALSGRPGYYAAFLVEPIQGEGGIVVPPDGYLDAAQRACRDAGVLFIVDEVQTGLGRTGSMFACEPAGVSPDILVLAKALGGGLLPIGACLYTNDVYNTDFELWHSSTFAGNTLACRAGLATLNLLEHDDCALVKRVAENGAWLKRELEALREQFPSLVTEIRGRGYMLGVELGLHEGAVGSDLLTHLADQQLLLQIVAGYLLNVERVRVAPASTGASVLRIEPPLIAQRKEGSMLVKALERTLRILQAGDAGALFEYMIGERGGDVPRRVSETESAHRSTQPRTRLAKSAGATTSRFAFLVHLLSSRDYADFDRSLSRFSERQLADLHRRMSHFVDPFPIGTISLESPTGAQVVGELILIPPTAEELMHFPARVAMAKIHQAAEIARHRGAEIVGLGGFTSVVTQGGSSLVGPGGAGLTNGNSYTVVMAKRAIELACAQRGVNLADATVAIVGAAGIIGRATALLMPQSVARMILIGNPALPERSLSRLSQVGRDVVEHIRAVHRNGRTFYDRTLAAHLATLANDAVGGAGVESGLFASDGLLPITTDLDGMLPQADVVISATNSVDVLIFERHLKQGAIVCDVSRPFNVCRDIRRTRPDVMLIDGGTVQVSGQAELSALRGANERHVPACVAETLLLAFERAFDLPGLCGTLQLETIHRLEDFGRKHGFEVALEADAWDLGDFG